ncbi:MAG: twin-arginine translocation signal domain-containing protein [Burkholderiaceae bacterium]|nr:twin-arginine translocation signal domain-containing protein [Burkholderiaceae bacterium]
MTTRSSLAALPRRRFVQGLAAGGVLAGLSPLLTPARAAADAAARRATPCCPAPNSIWKSPNCR